jgi:Cys-rich protein (TIGR01571 family)
VIGCSSFLCRFVSTDKMTPEQEQVIEEQQALLEESAKMYTGEMEPETKTMEPPTTPEYIEVANGVPAGPGGPVMGAPVSRSAWSTGLFSCLGSQDEFCSSDLEVCIVGTFIPCVLYGGNMERILPRRSSFCTHCLSYSSLYFLGNCLFNTNILAPCFSYPSRTALRRKFNLEGTGEQIANTFGCCGSVIDDDESHECCESVLDCAVHVLCHPCALCQESRELRRRLPHPAFSRPAYLPQAPPMEQHMVLPML